MNDKLINLIADFIEDEVISIIRESITQGISPMDILDDASRAMAVVRKRFEKGEYFIPDLMMAGEILKQVSEVKKYVKADAYGKDAVAAVALCAHWLAA